MERRAKAFWVGQREVLDMVTMSERMPAVLRVPMLDLPEGATVHSVEADWQRRAFVFIVEHPSFPVWADGDYCPDDGDRLQWSTLDVRIAGGPEATASPWEALVAENRRLRAILGDLRLDRPTLDAVYRQAIEDAARVAHGTDHGTGGLVAALIRKLGESHAG